MTIISDYSSSEVTNNEDSDSGGFITCDNNPEVRNLETELDVGKRNSDILKGNLENVTASSGEWNSDLLSSEIINNFIELNPAISSHKDDRENDGIRNCDESMIHMNLKNEADIEELICDDAKNNLKNITPSLSECNSDLPTSERTNNYMELNTATSSSNDDKENNGIRRCDKSIVHLNPMNEADIKEIISNNAKNNLENATEVTKQNNLISSTVNEDSSNFTKLQLQITCSPEDDDSENGRNFVSKETCGMRYRKIKEKIKKVDSDVTENNLDNVNKYVEKKKRNSSDVDENINNPLAAKNLEEILGDYRFVSGIVIDSVREFLKSRIKMKVRKHCNDNYEIEERKVIFIAEKVINESEEFGLLKLKKRADISEPGKTDEEKIKNKSRSKFKYGKPIKEKIMPKSFAIKNSFENAKGQRMSECKPDEAEKVKNGKKIIRVYKTRNFTRGKPPVSSSSVNDASHEEVKAESLSNSEPVVNKALKNNEVTKFKNNTGIESNTRKPKKVKSAPYYHVKGASLEQEKANSILEADKEKTEGEGRAENSKSNKPKPNIFKTTKSTLYPPTEGAYPEQMETAPVTKIGPRGDEEIKKEIEGLEKFEKVSSGSNESTGKITAPIPLENRVSLEHVKSEWLEECRFDAGHENNKLEAVKNKRENYRRIWYNNKKR